MMEEVRDWMGPAEGDAAHRWAIGGDERTPGRDLTAVRSVSGCARGNLPTG